MRPLAPSSPSRRPTAHRPTRTLPQDLPVVRFRLAAILAAQLFDFVTFHMMVQLQGIHFELNPIVAGTYHMGGFGILLLAKLALVALVGATVVILGRRPSVDAPHSRLATVVTLVAVYGGLVGGISNSLVIWS